MHRHRRVAPQPAALRDTVKQVYGATTSAVSEERKPPDILGEGTITRASGGPHGQHDSTIGVALYVVRVCGGHRAPSTGPRACRCRPTAALTRAGGGVAALPVHADPEAGGAGRAARSSWSAGGSHRARRVRVVAG